MSEGLLAGSGTAWPQLFEAGMLLCFAVSWPIAIVKMLKTRRAEGKSLGFVLLVLAGYLMGIAAKAAEAAAGQTALPAITWLYAFNTLTVALDAALQVYFTSHPGLRATLRIESS
jgi:hypothetical protein